MDRAHALQLLRSALTEIAISGALLRLIVLIAELQKALDSDERAFLLSLARNQADWKRLGIAHAAETFWPWRLTFAVDQHERDARGFP